MAQAGLKKTLHLMVQEHGLEQVNRTLTEIQVDLKDDLLSMVREYGVNQVMETLGELETSQSDNDGSSGDSASSNGNIAARKVRRNTRNTAPQYVAKMELRPEVETSVVKLASRFDDKRFLPTFGDIANFCEIYGIDAPASRSRASAIPRVFKFLASMESDDIEKIVKWEMFSGPSQLGPIADAIRRNGRAARAAETEGGFSRG